MTNNLKLLKGVLFRRVLMLAGSISSEIYWYFHGKPSTILKKIPWENCFWKLLWDLFSIRWQRTQKSPSNIAHFLACVSVIWNRGKSRIIRTEEALTVQLPKGIYIPHLVMKEHPVYAFHHQTWYHKEAEKWRGIRRTLHIRRRFPHHTE